MSSRLLALLAAVAVASNALHAGAEAPSGSAPSPMHGSSAGAPSPNEGADGVFEGQGEGFGDYTFFDYHLTPVPPPPPGPPGQCGDIGELCCEDSKCSSGGTCNEYDIFGNADYYPEANTCVHCGGYEQVKQGIPGVEYRFGELACKDGAPCEETLEVYDCEGFGPPLCEPCGKEEETCCNTGTPCEGDMVCLGQGYCGKCGGHKEYPCPGEGYGKCDDGLVARQGPPTNLYYSPEVLCLPRLACGTDPSAECCKEGPACPGTDGYGTPLTCIEGRCERCGLRGTPPCDDGCEKGLVDKRGLCRGRDDKPCGQSGEECCGHAYASEEAGRDYGDQCSDGLACEYDYGEYDYYAFDYGPFIPAPHTPPTCTPCGKEGQPPCQDARYMLGLDDGCDGNLELDSSGFSKVVCKAPCGVEGGEPCKPSHDDYDYHSGFSCACKRGLQLKGGKCEVAPSRPPSDRASPAKNDDKNSTEDSKDDAGMVHRQAHGGHHRDGHRGGHRMRRERRPREPRTRRERRPRGSRN